MVMAMGNPDLKWGFLVQQGPPQSCTQSAVVRLPLRRAVRLVQFQYECQYNCGFLKKLLRQTIKKTVEA